MKMNYLLDKKTVFTNRQKKDNRVSLLLVLLLIIVLYAFGSLVFPVISRPVLLAATPVLEANGRTFSFLRNTADFFSTKRSLVHENNRLKGEVRELEADLFMAGTRLADLTELDALVPDAAAEDYLIGRVTARPRSLPYDVLLLSVTDDSRISVGSPVTWRGGILLGEIVQLSGHSAKVKLYSSPGVKRRVLIGDDKITGVLTGQGGGNFTVELPRGLEIPVGARVFLAAQPEWILGVVGEVERKAENPFQTIYIQTPINIYTLEWVQINVL